MFRFSAKRIALLGILTALATITFMIEGLFPPLFLPGAKMGISNIFTLLAVILLSPLDGLILVAVRTTLGSLFTGGLSSWLYSFSAGVASVIVSGLLVFLFFDKISVVAISVAAAVVHNAVQNTVFCLVTGTPEMFVYLPYLALMGIVAGLIVGVVSVLLLKTLPFEKFLINQKSRF